MPIGSLRNDSALQAFAFELVARIPSGPDLIPLSIMSVNNRIFVTLAPDA
jgi:hypothetical protein